MMAENLQRGFQFALLLLLSVYKGTFSVQGATCLKLKNCNAFCVLFGLHTSRAQLIGLEIEAIFKFQVCEFEALNLCSRKAQSELRTGCTLLAL